MCLRFYLSPGTDRAVADIQRWFRRLLDWLFSGDHDLWLAVLRIGLGLQVIGECICLRADWLYFFGSAGQALIARQLSEAILSFAGEWTPRLGWLIDAGKWLGISENGIATLTLRLLFVAGLFLLLGFGSRPAAVVAWALHLCLVKSMGLLSYGADNFTTIGLFYLMLAPHPTRLSIDTGLKCSRSATRQKPVFIRRVLQLHLCLAYFVGGLAKAFGADWWNGLNLWRALTRPPFDVISTNTIAYWSWLLPAMGMAVWMLELSFPVLIFWRRTRLLAFCAIVLMHLGIALGMGMYSFAFIMIVLDTAAFGPGFSFSTSRPACSMEGVRRFSLDFASRAENNRGVAKWRRFAKRIC